MATNRTVAEIERDLSEASAKYTSLTQELMEAKLAKFLQESGVPEGVRPVFSNNNGERVLVDGFDGCFPMGRLIKKDGSVSKGTFRRLYPHDGYKFVPE